MFRGYRGYNKYRLTGIHVHTHTCVCGGGRGAEREEKERGKKIIRVRICFIEEEKSVD